MRIRRRAFRRASTSFKDDTGIKLGVVGKIEWTTNDANANCLLIDLPTGGATDVPVLLVAQTDADFGYFNGRTESFLAVEDADGDSYIGFGFSDDDKTELLTGGNVTELAITAPTVSFTSSTGYDITLQVGEDDIAGSIDMFPATSSKGKLTFSASDNAGDTTTTVTNASQAAARTYTIPDAGDDASFLMTDSTKTWWHFSVGVVGEDTDGAGTNGGGIGGGAPDLTTHQWDDGAGTVFVKVYDHGTTTWDDLKTSSNLTGWGNDYQLLPDSGSEASDDCVAVGSANKFCEIAFDDFTAGNGTLATWSGNSGKWQYSTGAGSWSDLTVFDNTDSAASDGQQPFAQIGAISFVPPSDWDVATYDDQEAYWIRWVFTAANLTQTPIIDDTNKDEPFVVIPNSDTFDAPFKCTISKIRVTDMGATVHDQAIKFIIANFTDGVYSSELSWTASQVSDTFTLGTPLAADADDLIGVCVTDDGGSTNNPAMAIELEATLLD